MSLPAALPCATFLAFTGTQLIAGEECTRELQLVSTPTSTTRSKSSSRMPPSTLITRASPAMGRRDRSSPHPFRWHPRGKASPPTNA